MKFSDAIFGFVLLILAVTVLAVTASYPMIPAQRVGPSLFPSLIASGLAVGGLILVISGWRARERVPLLRLDPWVRSPRHVAGAVAVIASIGLYIVAVDRVGFLLTAFAILLVLFRVFGVSWMRAFVIAAIATLIVHFAFYKLLRVPLPWGVLTGYAW